MKRKGEAFDYILLETTGLADPGPITTMFWQNEEFTQGLDGNEIYLDGVVCVVDAVFGLEQITRNEYRELSLRQIAHASSILVNKSDLASLSITQELETHLSTVNPLALIVRTVKGVVNLREVLDIGGFEGHRHLDPPAHIHEEGDEHGEQHPHPHDVEAVTIALPVLSTGQLEKLDEWVRSVLWEGSLPSFPEKVEILRCKALFSVSGGSSIPSHDEVYSLQGVQNIYEITPVKSDYPAPRDGKMVLIGKFGNMNAESVRKSAIEYLN